jgi:hypothetical protein
LTLLTVVRRVARQCGLTPPASVLGSGDETWLQFAEWAQEGVDDICLRHDWRALHETQTITGDGVTVAFNLNADFSRLSKMPAVSRDQSTSTFWPVGPVSPPAFIGAATQATFSTRPVFQIEAGVLTFVQAPATGETYTVSYQSSKPIISASVPVTEWVLDADTVLIPERLLRLYLRWQWRESKGLTYAEAMTSYERALETICSHDWGLIAVDLSGPEFDDEFGDVTVDA